MNLTKEKPQTKSAQWSSATVTEAHLLCLDQGAAFGTIGRREPICLTPLAGKPMLDRLLGRLADLEIERIVLYVGGQADLIGKYVGNGQRWGLNISVVDMPSPAKAIGRILGSERNYPILIADTGTLPSIQPHHLSGEKNPAHLVLHDSSGKSLPWIILRRPISLLADQSIDSIGDLRKVVASQDEIEAVGADPTFSINTPGEFLKAQKLLLSGHISGQPVPGNQLADGIRIGGNVSLHPTATLIPPVMINADCLIARGARLGPNVVVGSKTIVGDKTSLENCCILPNTYLGRDLSVENAIVDRNCLLCGQTSVSTMIPDSFLIGPNNKVPIGQWLAKSPSILAAWLALVPGSILFGVLYLLARLLGVRNPIRHYRAVRLPAAEDSRMWQQFTFYEFARGKSRFFDLLVNFLRLRRLPTVWNIARGQIAWVGLRPRRPEQITALPEDWRELYLTCKVGMVRLAELDAATTGVTNIDQVYSSEAFYSVDTCYKRDLKILWRALWTRAKHR
jgi:Bacterial sugar transferase